MAAADWEGANVPGQQVRPVPGEQEATPDVHQESSGGPLSQELARLRQRVAALEAAAARQQQIEEARHVSKMRFRTLVEGSLQGILVHRNHKPLFVNQAFAAMLGYAMPDDILRMDTVLPLVTPEDRGRLGTYCAARLRGDAVPEQYVYRALRRDGTTLWVEVRVTMVEWDGAPAMLLTTVEITARKQAEAALARYHLLAAQTQDIILFIGRHGRIVDANHAAVAAYGYDRDTLLTLTIADLRAPGTMPLVAGQMAQADTAGIRFETMHRRCDGSAFPVEVSSIGAEIDGERVLLSIIRDATERQQAEAALRREREILQKLIDTIPVMIAMYKPDIHVLQLNSEFERVTGWSTAAAREVDLMAQCYPDPAYREQVRRYMESLESGWQDLQMVTKDGQVIETSWANLRLSDATHIGVGIDITPRKQAEIALQRAHAELEQRVQERTASLHREMAERQRLEREAQRAQHFALLGQLAAGVSHEIRNPLAAVFLHVDLLEEELAQPSPDSQTHIAESFREIKTHLGRLEDLVQDYLSLVRVTTIQREPTHLGNLVTDFAQELTAECAARGILLQSEGLAQLGTVALHPNTFRRALLNLVHNALDAMPYGGTLTLRGQQDTSRVRLEICDTGNGIPLAHLGRIFEPLYTTKPGGTGLGLYIVQEIVVAHGGQVGVASIERQGTIFTITLPRTVPTLPIPAAS